MISLISRWKLRNGCPPELAEALRNVAATVKAQEPTTLVYSVHLDGPGVLDQKSQPKCPPPDPIPPEQQTEVVFFEVYADADAFAAHVNGPAFTAFLKGNLKYFYENPDSPGWPNTENTMLERQSAFFRPEANG